MALGALYVTLHPNPGALPDPHFVFPPRARGRRGLRNLLCASTAAPLLHAPVILLTLKKYVCARARVRACVHFHMVIRLLKLKLFPSYLQQLPAVYMGFTVEWIRVVLAQEQTVRSGIM